MRAYVSAAAQSDNLGDIIIRRNLISWLSRGGAEPHVLTRGMPDTYVDALELDACAVTHVDRAAWLRSFVRSCQGAPTILAFAPGPQELVAGRAEVAHAVTNLALARSAKLSGGLVVKVGRSFTGDSRAMRWLESSLEKQTDLYAVRDLASRDLTRGARFAPDIAVEKLVVRPESPKYIGFSFRGDRTVPLQDLREIVSWARETGLEPIVATQVRSDEPQHEDLARDLGARHLAWSPDGHHDQLRRLNDVYGSMALMVSNRLHSLILAWNRGAVPLGHAASAGDKVTRHLSSMGMDDFVLGLTMSPTSLFSRYEDGLTARSDASLVRCSSEVEALRDDLWRLMRAMP